MRRPEFVDMDPLFEDVAEWVVQNQSVTISDIQNQFGLGLTRAEKLIGQLESAGIIGVADGDNCHQSLIASIDTLDALLWVPGHEAQHIDYDDEEIEDYVLSDNATPYHRQTKSKNPEYSDSVNAMNGCLGYFLEIIQYLLLIILFLALAPYVLLIAGVWWVIAWILGLIFPGKEFFPIKKWYHSFKRWFSKFFGIPLEDIAMASILTVVLGSLLNSLSNLFPGKK